MGSSGGGTTTQETSLSRQQAKILSSREDQYQNYFFPELIKELEGSGSQAFENTLRNTQQGQISQTYQASSSALQKQLAQRGLSGSGVEAASLAQLSGERSKATSELAEKARLSNDQKRMNLLQMGGSLSPQPTTAAPYTQETEKSKFMGLW